MPAYKRSDPTKLLKDRQKIIQDMEDKENVPQSQRMFPNLIEQGRRAIDNAIQKRRQRRNPPPSPEGAQVIGTQPPGTLS